MVDRAKIDRPYHLGRQAKTIVSFIITTWSKAIILGQQTLYTAPDSSTAQEHEMVLPSVSTRKSGDYCKAI